MKYIVASIFSLFCLCPFVQAQDEEVWDPIEPVNRGIFWFNDKFDRYLLEPVSIGYDTVLPDSLQSHVTNFFSNLSSPIDIVNSLLQLKFEQTATLTGRLLVNSTIGGLGLFDVATDLGLDKYDEDAGLTFAHYGIPTGPYIVLPFLGPSNLRDAVGKGGDLFLHPLTYVSATEWSDSTQTSVALGGRGLEVVDTRVNLKESIDTARESSIDYYLFVQSAYYQYRRGRVEGKNASTATPKDNSNSNLDEEKDIGFKD